MLHFYLNAVVFIGVVTDFNRSGGAVFADGLWAALEPTFLSLAIEVPAHPESQSGQVREGGVLREGASLVGVQTKGKGLTNRYLPIPSALHF